MKTLTKLFAFLMLATFVFSANVSFGQKTISFNKEDELDKFILNENVEQLNKHLLKTKFNLNYLSKFPLKREETYIKSNEYISVIKGERIIFGDLTFIAKEPFLYNPKFKIVFSNEFSIYGEWILISVENITNKNEFIERFGNKIQLDIETTNFKILNSNFELTKKALNPTHRILSTGISIVSVGIGMGLLSTGKPEDIKSAGTILGIGAGLSLLTYIIGEYNIYGFTTKIQPIIK